MHPNETDNLQAFRRAWESEFGQELSEDNARLELDRLALLYRTLADTSVRKPQKRPREDGYSPPTTLRPESNPDHG